MSPSQSYHAKFEKILDEGTSLLWSKGFNATSVNDIVKAAGIPKGSFYHYFESKEDFVNKALDHYYEGQVFALMSSLSDDTISAKQRLVNYYSDRVKAMKGEMNCTKGCLGGNLASEVAEHKESVRLNLLEKHAKVIHAIALVIKEAQDAGEISSMMSPHDLAEFIEDSSKGALISMKEMKSPYPLENHLKMVKEILLR